VQLVIFQGHARGYTTNMECPQVVFAANCVIRRKESTSFSEIMALAATKE
jgi:hypothetical protein